MAEDPRLGEESVGVLFLEGGGDAGLVTVCVCSDQTGEVVVKVFALRSGLRRWQHGSH